MMGRTTLSSTRTRTRAYIHTHTHAPSAIDDGLAGVQRNVGVTINTTGVLQRHVVLGTLRRSLGRAIRAPKLLAAVIPAVGYCAGGVNVINEFRTNYGEILT